MLLRLSLKLLAVLGVGEAMLIDFLVGPFPTQLVTREWVLGATWIMCGWLCVSYLSILLPELLKQGISIYKEKWFQAGLADLSFTFGIGLRCVWVWMVLFSFTHNRFFGGIDDHWWLDIVSLVFTVVGGVCKQRIYTPDYVEFYRRKMPLGNRLWVIGALSMAIVMTAVHLAVPLGSLPK